MYSLELPHPANANEYIQHPIILSDQRDIPKLSPFASWSGIMINPQWLELQYQSLEQIPMVPKMFEALKFSTAGPICFSYYLSTFINLLTKLYTASKKASTPPHFWKIKSNNHYITTAKKVMHQGYKTFFMLNSADHEIFSANKYENGNYCWHFHIY